MNLSGVNKMKKNLQRIPNVDSLIIILCNCYGRRRIKLFLSIIKQLFVCSRIYRTMTQVFNKQQFLQPTTKLRSFIDKVSNHFKMSSKFLSDSLIKDILATQIDELNIQVDQSTFKKQESEQKPTLQKAQQKHRELPHDLSINNNDPQKNQKNFVIGQMMNSIAQKQHESFKDLINNLNQNQQESPQKQNDDQSPQFSHQQDVPQKNQLNGEQLQKLQKMQKMNHQLSSSKQEKQPKPSSMQEVSTFCQNLKQSFNQQVYNKDSISKLTYQLKQVLANNSYLCIQQSFEKLKSNYEHSRKQQKDRNKSNASSVKLNQSGSQQFDLSLTLKSRNSKKSRNFELGDSLMYSNATSFGLQSTQNKSKPLSRHDLFSRNQASSKLANDPSLKILRPRDENETDIHHIERAESRGEVDMSSRGEADRSSKGDAERSSRGEVEHDRFPSGTSISDNERLQKYPPRKSIKNSSGQRRNSEGKRESGEKSEEKRNSSSNEYLKLNFDIEVNPVIKVIKEENDYEVIPLTQQHDIVQESSKEEKEGSLIDSPAISGEKKMKKQFSINNIKDKLKSSRKSINRSKNQDSVFSSEISHLQSRISRVKEAKIVKKLQLQAQLRKINQQIENIKLEQQSPQCNKQPQSSKKLLEQQKSLSRLRQNTLQSRIKINDNLQEKQKAVNLVRNLRADRMSRQNQKRSKIKAVDRDLHQEIEDIMKLKYFNEERLKQKRQLQIIDRMKRQEMRKINEQKRKQQSAKFLAKLKDPNRQAEASREKPKAKHIQQLFTQDAYDSPIKKTQSLVKKTQSSVKKTQSGVKRTQLPQIKEPLSTSAVDRKKAYVNKIKNFTIIKTRTNDIYEQALN